MNKPKTVMLITQDMQRRCFSPADLERIAAVADLHPPTTDELTPEAASFRPAADDAAQSAAISGAQIAITGWDSRPITTAMLDAAPDLKLLCHSAGSVKSFIDTRAFLDRGVRVCSARAALAVGVAEFTFGMMLVSMKAVWRLTAAARRGVWDRDEDLEWVREPYGATIGIIGASCVGREMIRLCRTLDLEAILLYDPYVTAREAETMGAVKVDIDDLMRRADVVSLHTPATDETRHIINARNLALLKDRAIFLNTARGMCVDEPALIAELEKGRILACLDVTDPEAPAPGSPLYSLPNCILTPHVAGAIKENTFRQGRLVAGQIEAFVRGRPLPGEIDLTRHERLA